MSGSPIRVVLFDDNKDLRDMFRLLVDAQSDMVCVAVHPDLSQMMRDIDAARPDVIVMDIQMPGMSGIEALQRLRGAAGPNQFIPVIALTADLASGGRERYIDFGFDDQASKPIQLNVLMETMSRVLAGATSAPKTAANAA